MTRYILDSNALSAFINHMHGVDTRVREAKRRGDKTGTCVPIIGELFYGLELSTSRDTNLKRAQAGIRQVTLWPFDLAAGQEFGRSRAQLRRIGRSMQTVDIQLAAIALSLGNCTVVTTDTDLAAVPGLRTENWASPPA